MSPRETVDGVNGHAVPEALGTLFGDMERKVREALAEHLRRCPYLPPSLARSLAGDLASPTAMAWERDGRLARSAVLRILEDYGSGDRAVDGERLPLEMTQHAIFRLSETLRADLIERHQLPEALANEMIMHGRERALTKAMSAEAPDTAVEALVEKLMLDRALTPTLLLRSLCLGHLRFFAAAMAALAGLPRAETAASIYQGEPKNFQKLYERTGLPSDLYRAFRAATDVIRQLPPAPAQAWRREHTGQIIARLVKEYEQVCPEDLEHVLSQISRHLTQRREASA